MGGVILYQPDRRAVAHLVSSAIDGEEELRPPGKQPAKVVRLARDRPPVGAEEHALGLEAKAQGRELPVANFPARDQGKRFEFSGRSVSKAGGHCLG